MKKYIIKEENQNIRIDKIIGDFEKDISRTTIQRMIDEENILVNGKKVDIIHEKLFEDKERSFWHIISEGDQL